MRQAGGRRQGRLRLTVWAKTGTVVEASRRAMAVVRNMIRSLLNGGGG
jgi:hypothetical protein